MLHLCGECNRLGVQTNKIIGRRRGRHVKLLNWDAVRRYKNQYLPVPGRMITPSSIPILTMRLVPDLEFSQAVLNCSCALIGLPVVAGVMAKKDNRIHERDSYDVDNNNVDRNAMDENPSQWLPPKLETTHPYTLGKVSEVVYL